MSVLSCIPVLYMHAVVLRIGALGLSRKCLAPFSVVMEDFKTSNICIDNCVYYDSCDAPTSVVIINQSNGSRTIIHSNNNLPELTLDDFKKLDLSQYSWIHFEASSPVCPVSVMQKPNTLLNQLSVSPEHCNPFFCDSC
jgi:sugar/nucleoside kinase (ribokinase family)